MQKILKIAIGIYLLCFCHFAFGQGHPLIRYADYSNDLQIKRLYDSLRAPIVICKNTVWIMNPECKAYGSSNRNIGWDANSGKHISIGESRNIGWDANSDGTHVSIGNSRNIGWDANSGKHIAIGESRNIGWDANSGSISISDSRNIGWDANSGTHVALGESRNIGWDANSGTYIAKGESRNIGWDANTDGFLFTCHLNSRGTLLINVFNNKHKEQYRVFDGIKYHTVRKSKYKVRAS